MDSTTVPPHHPAGAGQYETTAETAAIVTEARGMADEDAPIVDGAATQRKSCHFMAQHDVRTFGSAHT
jgi:hypothetical protein